MSENAVALNILDREFLIGCTPDERPSLIAAASYLDAKMREVRAVHARARHRSRCGSDRTEHHA